MRKIQSLLTIRKQSISMSESVECEVDPQQQSTAMADVSSIVATYIDNERIQVLAWSSLLEGDEPVQVVNCCVYDNPTKMIHHMQGNIPLVHF